MTNEIDIYNGDDFLVTELCSTEPQPIYSYQVMGSKKLFNLLGMFVTSGDKVITNKNDLYTGNVSFNFEEGVVIKVASISYTADGECDLVRVKVISNDKRHFRQISLPFEFLKEKLDSGVFKHMDRDVQLKDILITMSNSIGRNGHSSVESYQSLFNISNYQVREMIRNIPQKVKVTDYTVSLKKKIDDGEIKRLKRLEAISVKDDGWYIANNVAYTPKSARNEVKSINNLIDSISNHHFEQVNVPLTKLEFSDAIFVIYGENFHSLVEPIVHATKDTLHCFNEIDFIEMSLENFEPRSMGKYAKRTSSIINEVVEYLAYHTKGTRKTKKPLYMICM